jgi:ABC-type transport system involved in cytochrome c biogenesis permease component
MPIAPYLTIAGMLFLVLFPVLVPVVISAVHYVTDPARTSIQERVASYFPQRTAPRRLGFAAAAA